MLAIASTSDALHPCELSGNPSPACAVGEHLVSMKTSANTPVFHTLYYDLITNAVIFLNVNALNL